jgi:cell division protein FtsB
MRYWHMITRLIWIPIALIGVVAVISWGMPKCQEYQRLQNSRMALDEENNHLESNIRQLETKHKRFAYDKDFVERTARELGMAKPGETIYKFNAPEDH